MFVSLQRLQLLAHLRFQACKRRNLLFLIFQTQNLYTLWKSKRFTAGRQFSMASHYISLVIYLVGVIGIHFSSHLGQTSIVVSKHSMKLIILLSTEYDPSVCISVCILTTNCIPIETCWIVFVMLTHFGLSMALLLTFI